MNPATEGNVPAHADVEILPVERPPEFVLAFPAFMAVTIRTKPGVALSRAPVADILRLNQCIGLEMQNDAGAVVHKYVPTPVVDRELGKPGSRVEPGESRRMLTDISELVPPDIAEGTYTLRVSYVIPRGAYAAAPFTIRIRRPSPPEAAFLAAAAPDRGRYQNWAVWATTCPTTSVYGGPIDPGNPLTLYLLLRRVLCTPGGLAQFDPTIFDTLQGVYEPEGQMLKAELYQARGDVPRYQQTRAAVLQRYASLTWWGRMLDAGGAYLRTLRFVP